MVYASRCQPGYAQLYTFDGTQAKALRSVADFTVSGAWFYVVALDGTVTRTADLQTWQEVGKGPDTATAIGVLAGRVYLGTLASELYEASAALP